MRQISSWILKDLVRRVLLKGTLSKVDVICEPCECCHISTFSVVERCFAGRPSRVAILKFGALDFVFCKKGSGNLGNLK